MLIRSSLTPRGRLPASSTAVIAKTSGNLLYELQFTLLKDMTSHATMDAVGVRVT